VLEAAPCSKGRFLGTVESTGGGIGWALELDGFSRCTRPLGPDVSLLFKKLAAESEAILSFSEILSLAAAYVSKE